MFQATSRQRGAYSLIILMTKISVTMFVTIPSHSTPLLIYPVILCRLLSLARLFAPPIIMATPSTSALLARHRQFVSLPRLSLL